MTSAGAKAAFRLVRPASPPADAVMAAPDEAQARVVAHRSGPLLVLGGPGTGKTTTLVEAVAARIAEGVDPERILVLTFGRRGATRAARPHRGPDRRPRAPHRARAVGAHLPRRTPSACCAAPRPSGASRRRGCSPAPSRTCVIRELLRGRQDPATGRLAGDLRPALRTRAFAAQLRDLLHAGRRARASARSSWPGWASAGPRRLAGRGAASSGSTSQVLALRDATHPGLVGVRPGRAGPGRGRAAASTIPSCWTAERRRLAHVYVDELADTDPAQIELLALVAGGGRPWSRSPTRTPRCSPSAAPTRRSWATFPQRFRSTAGGAAAGHAWARASLPVGPLADAAARIAGRLRSPAGLRGSAAPHG